MTKANLFCYILEIENTYVFSMRRKDLKHKIFNYIDVKNVKIVLF